MKTVLITGANRGLGLEFCRQYAQTGWQVIACCRLPNQTSALEKVAEQHDTVTIARLDVRDHKQIEALALEFRAVTIDLLISNAGIYGDSHRFGHIDYQSWQDTMQVNVFSAIKLAETFADHLVVSKQGLFVAISSLMGSIADNDSGGSYLYRSSKAALNAAMKSLSFDFARQGTGVLIFHPGWVRTDMGGPHGLIDVHESISGMRQVIDDFTLSQTGRFVKYDGSEMPW